MSYDDLRQNLDTHNDGAAEDDIALGCNDCEAVVTHTDFLADPAADFGWEDLGDDGARCPECSAKARA